MDENIDKEELKQENVQKIEPEVEAKSSEPVKDRKGFAIASMILGIIALVLFCLWYISVPCAILSIIFGAMSLKSSKRGMAISGIVTGAIGIVLMIIFIIMVFVIGIGATNSVLNRTQDILDDDYYDYYDYDYDYYDSSDWF